MLNNAYSRALVIIILGLIPFVLTRALLLAAYPEDFAELAALDVLGAFVNGLRFDASILIQLIGLPILLSLMPFRWTHRLWWQRLWGWWIFATLALLVFLLSVDLIYFGVVHRHIGPESAIITGDPSLMVAMALSDYAIPVILFIVGSIAGGRLWRHIVGTIPTPPAGVAPRLALMVLIFAVFVVVGRGGLHYKPIGIVNAFGEGPLAAGYLTLNGPFSIAHSLISSQPQTVDFFTESEAIAKAREAIFSAGEKPVDEAYPLMRHNPGQEGPKPNVVVLMLESWDAEHIDALRILDDKPPLGATPNFDALAEQGLLHSRFYAAGQRSMDGMAALLAGIPTLPGMPYIGNGLEQNALSFLGHLAASQGYETIFLQSSKRGSFHVDSIAARAGFQTYLGAEDIPPAHENVEEESGWGVWDHDTFQMANNLFAQASSPFLGFVFTSSTHQPWKIPLDTWRKFEEDTDDARYLNSLFYADWALGEFIAAAKASGYYDNTIFVITGDHISHVDVRPGDVAGSYHIPLLIVGPGLQPGIDAGIGSQLDVIPTIIDLAGWNVTHASIGRSLLEQRNADETRGAFAVNWKNIEWIGPKGWISHNLTRRIAANVQGSTEDAEAMEQRLLAIYQAMVTLLLENRLYRDGVGASAE